MELATAIRLPKSFIESTKPYAKQNFRSVPKQIEYWASLGKIAEENPDLPLDFIKQVLLAKDEASIPFAFTTASTTSTKNKG